MVNFKYDKNAFLYLAAIIAGYALIFLSEQGLGNFLGSLFFYVGVVAMAFFSFVLIIFGFLSIFHKH